MALILTISASPSPRSKTALTRAYVDARLAASGHEVRSLDVRDLPAAALLAADASHPAIAGALASLAEADAVVVATPVYKASFSGLLKTLLDLLPQRALDGKVVLPLAVGGSLAHVLMLDYSLRPVLIALGAEDILRGLFVHDAQIGLDDGPALAGEAETALGGAVDRLAGALARRVPLDVGIPVAA
jgi:FMN reductase